MASTALLSARAKSFETLLQTHVPRLWCAAVSPPAFLTHEWEWECVCVGRGGCGGVGGVGEGGCGGWGCVCGVVWCGVVWCGVVWCGVVWCGVVWCGVVWCVVWWCGRDVTHVSVHTRARMHPIKRGSVHPFGWTDQPDKSPTPVLSGCRFQASPTANQPTQCEEKDCEARPPQLHPRTSLGESNIFHRFGVGELQDARPV